MNKRLSGFALALCACLHVAAAHPDYAGNIASLIDPAKLATLGKRAANPRLQKCVYWLAEARNNGQKPDAVLDTAIVRVGIRGGLAATLTKEALLRSLSIAEKTRLPGRGRLKGDAARQGAAVRPGPYAGDQLSVDDIIPVSVAPEPEAGGSK
jgi:hypothetical protein